MCNACGFLCCASDVFDSCGCEFCPNSDCWPDEPDDEFDYDADHFDREREFRCDSPAPERCHG